MKRLVRWSSRGPLLVVVVGVGLRGYAEGRQWLLRWRAERLLADIQSLNVSQSTGTDAQIVGERWKKWSYPLGSCTRDQCDYFIGMGDGIPFEYGFGFDTFEGFHPFARVLDRLGIRSSVISVVIDVRKDVVVGKEFTVVVSRPVRFWKEPDHSSRREIVAAAREGAHLRGICSSSYSGNIYSVVRTWAHGTLMAESTPQEPLEHRRALMQFSLDCITKWSPCLQNAQLLPEAAAEFAAVSESQMGMDRGAQEIHNCTGRNLEFLARQSDEVWIVTAEAKPEPKGADGAPSKFRVYLQPQQILKGKSAPTGGQIQTMWIADRFPPVGLDIGRRFLMFGALERAPTPVFFQAEACSYTPVSPENVADVRRGVAEDFDPGEF